MFPSFILQRSLHFFIFFCTASLSLSSCTRQVALGDKDSLKVALSAAPATLDPRRATDATGMRMCNLIFQSLVRLGPDLEVEGDAAETWNFKNNVYTFKLKSGLEFQNGRAVSPEDILFSFDEFRSTRSPFSSAFKPIKKVSVNQTKDRMVVSIEVDQYSSKFLSSDLPVIKILPKQEAEKENFSSLPIGSGPLMIKEFNSQVITLERVHKKDDGHFNRFNFKVIKDDFTRSQKILKGEIDIAIAELPADIVKRLQDKEPSKVQVKTYSGLSMTYLLVNLKDSELKRKEVRKAISQAINRDEMIKYKLLGLGEEATSILTPTNPYFNSDLKNPKYNLEAAKSVLEKVDHLSLKTSSNPSAVDHGKVLAYQLGKTGVNVQLQSFEWGTFYNDIKTGNFQLATMKWVGAFDPDIYRIAFHSSELPPGRNRSYYINKTLDELMEKAFRLESEEKRKEMYLQIQKVIFEDYAIIPLWYETQAVVMNKNLMGFETSTLSDYYGLLKVKKEKGT